jgi:hypothetical protein
MIINFSSVKALPSTLLRTAMSMYVMASKEKDHPAPTQTATIFCQKMKNRKQFKGRWTLTK